MTDELLDARVERESSAPVDAATVSHWCRTFGVPVPSGLTEPGSGWVVPPAMITTFARPVAAPPAGEPVPAGVELHDRLKSVLGLPMGIAVGYELESLGGLGEGDRLRSVERIASLGDERPTRYGPGRDWVIEVASSTLDGRPIAIERWSMIGYRRGERSEARAVVGEQPPESAGAADEWSSTLAVTDELIVTMAAANRVWAPVHHDERAARAAGLAGLILDTSSQVALMSVRAVDWLGGDGKLIRFGLEMRRSIVGGDELEVIGARISGTTEDSGDGGVTFVDVTLVARSSERVASVATARFAVPAA